MTESQNIYDDPRFFASYEQLRRTGAGLNDAIEQPALWAMLPQPLAGLRVLDLGCGFGDFARKVRGCGARSVLGIDLSQRMLAAAARQTDDAEIQYRCASIERLDLEGLTFDLVVSSLALHYVNDYGQAVAHVAALLADGGWFVFSVEHPMCTAMAQQQWVRDPEGRALYWPIDDYRMEGERQTTWFVDGVIKYHRTIETYVNGLIGAGFTLRGLREPEPVDLTAPIPDLTLHRRRPPFLLLAAER